MMLANGETVTTNTGRETTPFPNPQKRNSSQAVDRWLLQNALDEARSRGDAFNARQFEANLARPSQADKDSAEAYLFDPDFVFDVPRPTIRPLAAPAAPAASPSPAPQAAPVAEASPAPSAAAPQADTRPQPRSTRTVAEDTTITASGREIPVTYAVVEAEDLVASQTDNGAPNPAYPAEMQPRDRTRGVSQAQIAEIAQNLNPRLLDRNPMASDGAPIIAGDGVVESGNGRVLAIRRAYAQGFRTAEAYRAYLAEQGYPVDGMRQPVLVRIRRGEMGLDDRRAFTREANERSTLGMSATERALADAAAMSDDVLATYRGGDVTLAANREFVRRFIDEVVSPGDRAGMVGSDGALSQEAARRIEAAMLARAYGDADLVSALVESPDVNIKAIGGALMDVAAEWAQMRAEAASEAISPEVDQTPALLEAVRMVQRARREGNPLFEYVGQMDAFSGRAISEGGEQFLRLMFHNISGWTRPGGREKVAKALRFYVTEARKTGTGEDLLGAQPTPPAEILDLARSRTYDDQAAGQQGDLISARPRFARTDAGVRREPGAAQDRPGSENARSAEAPRERRGERRVGAPGLRATGREAEQLKKQWRSQTQFTDANEMLASGPANQAALGEAGRRIAAEIGGEFKDPGVKALPPDMIDALPADQREAKLRGLARFREKVAAADRPGAVTDLVRAGFLLDNPEQGDAIAARLAERFELIDEGWAVTPAGYFDRKLYARFPDGMIGEIQMWEPSLFSAKELRGGHKLYEQARALPRGASRRRPLEARMRDLYWSALAEAGSSWNALAGNGGNSPNRSTNASSESSLPSTPTSAESASDQVSSTNTQASPGVQRAGSPSNDANSTFIDAAPETEVETFVGGRLRVETTPLTERLALLEEAVRQRLSDLGLSDIGVRIVQGIRSSVDGNAVPVDAMYLRRVITMALNATSEQTVDHEAIHALKNLGLFTRAEWDTLAARARRDWMRRYRIAERYGDLSTEAQIEEAIAHAFPDWVAGNLDATTTVQRVMQRIRDFVERIGSALRGAGFRTAEEVFGEIEAGAIGGRERPGQPFFDRNDADIRFLRPNPPPGPFETYEDLTSHSVMRMFGSWQRLRDAKSWQDLLWLTRRTFQDDRAAWMRQQRAAERGATPVPPHMDPSLQMELYRGTSGTKVQEFYDERMRPILKRMRAAGLTAAEMKDFLFARHVPERNAQIAKLYADRPQRDEVRATRDENVVGGSGYSNRWARETMARLRQNQAKFSVMQAIAADLDAINNERLDRLVSAGILSQEEVDARRRAYRHYTPMRGWEGEEASEGWGTGSGYDQRGRDQRAMGRGSEADNPLGYTFMLAAQSIVKAEKAKVSRAVLRFAEAHPNPNAWEVNRTETVRRIKDAIVTDPQTGLAVKRQVVREDSQPPSRMDDNTLIVKVGGRDVYITFKSRDIAAVFRNLDPQRMNVALQGLAGFTRLLAALNTSWNPEWFVVNIARDLTAAGIQISDQQRAGLARQMLKNWPAALKGAFQHNRGNLSSRWAQIARDFQEAGGKVSFLNFQSVEDLKALIETEVSGTTFQRMLRAGPKPALDAIEVFTQAGENAIRIAAYKAALDAGLSKPKAASMARNLTVDFNKRGTLSPTINAFYMFFNAAVQGNVRLLQSVMRSKFTRRALVGLIGLGFLEALLGSADEEEYEKVEMWVRERNFVIMLNPLGLGDPGEFVKIPLPYGFNVFKALGTEFGRTALIGQDPVESAANAFRAAINSFNPIGGQDMIAVLTPTVLDPFMEVARNESFFGSSIAPDWPNDMRPPSERYYPNINPWIASFTRWLNNTTGGNTFRAGALSLNPEHIDHVLSTYLGGTGRLIKNTTEAIENAVSGRAIETERTPFARQIFGRTIGEMPTIRAYNRIADEVLALEFEIKEMAEAGRIGEARAAAQRDPRLTRTIGIVRTTERLLRDLRSAERKIRGAEMPEERRELAIERLRERQHDIRMRALDRINRVLDQEAEPAGIRA